MEGLWTKRKIRNLALAGTVVIGTGIFSACCKNASGSEVYDKLTRDEITYGDKDYPDNCKTRIEIGNTELVIDAEVIEAPDDLTMYEVSYEQKNIDDEYKKKVIDNLFGDISVYIYEGGYTKEERAAMLEYFETLEKEAVANGDTAMAGIYEISRSDYQDEENCTEREPVDSDYSGDVYVADVDGVFYLLEFLYEDGVYSGMELSYLHDELAINAKPYKDYHKVSIEGRYGDAANSGLTDGQNECSITAEYAESVAADFLADLGIGDMAVTENQGLVCGYEGYDNQGNPDMEYALNGYSITLSRSLQGVTEKVWLNDAMDTVSYGEDSNHICTVWVDDTGIIGFHIDNGVERTDDEMSRVDLLAWEDLLTAMENGGVDYLATEFPNYKSVAINYITLTYAIVRTDGSYAMKPVWEFMYFDDTGMENEIYIYPETVIGVDAQTGEFVYTDDILF